MAKKWEIDKHTVSWDGELIRLKINGIFSVENNNELIKVYDDVFSGMDKGRFVIIDLSEAAPMPKDTRLAMKENASRTMGQSDKTGFVGASPGIKMIARIISKFSGKDNSKFFNTEEEAIKWFKEG